MKYLSISIALHEIQYISRFHIFHRIFYRKYLNLSKMLFIHTCWLTFTSRFTHLRKFNENWARDGSDNKCVLLDKENKNLTDLKKRKLNIKLFLNPGCSFQISNNKDFTIRMMIWPEAGWIQVVQSITHKIKSCVNTGTWKTSTVSPPSCFLLLIYLTLVHTHTHTHTHTYIFSPVLSSYPVTDLVTEIIIAPWFNPSIPLGLLVLVFPIFGFLIGRLCEIMRYGISHYILII